MQQDHFQQNVTSWCLRNDTHFFLFCYFCIWTSYLSHSDCFVVILKFDSVPMFLHATRNFVNQTAFSSKHVSTFLTRKYDVISQLRHSYAKDPFCVTRLISLLRLYKKRRLKLDQMSRDPEYDRLSIVSFLYNALSLANTTGEFKYCL